eukprot:8347645-Alexandrium_andersonii.AAC.1
MDGSGRALGAGPGEPRGRHATGRRDPRVPRALHSGVPPPHDEDLGGQLRGPVHSRGHQVQLGGMPGRAGAHSRVAAHEASRGR